MLESNKDTSEPEGPNSAFQETSEAADPDPSEQNASLPEQAPPEIEQAPVPEGFKKRSIPLPAILFFSLAVVCLAAGLYVLFRPQPELTDPIPAVSESVTEPEPEDTSAEESEPLEDDGLPHDKLFITVERQEYESGDLTLIIPALDKTLTVYDGTDSATLLNGVGLYEYAQLPGEGNRNVSIAGHRNGLRNGQITDSAPFYYIDTLTEGDYLYLVDDESIYRYLYEDTTVVEADDWGPIYSQGFSCLTLTSCTPIGISDHRIIVRGRLDAIIEYTADYDYPASENDLSDES